MDYLGRRLNLARLHDTELEHRLEKGWKKFFANKADLCGKHAALNVRLKLFNAIITPTILYGSASWTMTVQRERLLRTTQRRMMRKILGSGRRPAEVIDSASDSRSESVGGSTVNTDCDDQPMKEDETWVEWLKRTTGIVEKQLKAAGLDDWVVSQRKRK